ncbi:MAG: hypothetical protein L6R41_003503 [Letrouitia leprolyta]|nr:MAG: hypothetical protein L6R41_003503 [Letrouitia leprolyta]
MTSPSISSKLPNFLFNGWQFRQNDISEAKARGDLQGWTVSSLCSAYLKYQLDRHLQANDQVHPPSLSSVTVAQILKTLKLSTNLQADLKTLTESLDSATLRHILQDPRTPYPILRLLDALPSTTIKGSSGDRKIVDIDEIVLAGEQYIRAQKSKCGDDYLVTLDDLSELLGPPVHGLIDIRRKTPPSGGFEFLDQKRKPFLQIQGTHASFVKTFDRVTKGVLKGLDWSHVFAAGGIVINTLLHCDPSQDNQGDVHECDIDLYLYDLTPEEANRKVQGIYRVWVINNTIDSANGVNRNFSSEHIVIKNAKTISFIPTFPRRRIQIILKLVTSPLDILLNIDLDACALGFDGSRVLMLPRCARAIEAGYSVFTMDLIWGHHLGNRRESQEIRIFKYADRGFGLRILPSYVRSLEKQGSKDKLPSENEAQRDMVGPTRTFDGEAGLKTLRRIAFVARYFVDWCYFRHPNCFVKYEGRYTDNERRTIIGNRSPTAVVSTKSTIDEDLLSKGGLATYGNDLRPLITLRAIAGFEPNGAFPQGRKSLGVFEVFMRRCEAWRLDAVGLAELDRSPAADVAYDDLGSYDGLPQYSWGAGFDNSSLQEYIGTVDLYNSNLFSALRQVVAQKLNVDPHQGGYRDYLTRRIRRLVVGRDLDSVQAKQLTMPLLIPMDLETHITNELAHRYDGLPEDVLSQTLIPAHDPSKYDPATAILPTLNDTFDEKGNLRYWLISNKSMWARQHRVVDEVSEILAALFDWFVPRDGPWDNDAQDDQSDSRRETNYATDNPRCIWHLAERMRRCLILPEASGTPEPERSQTLSVREARLFRAWVLERPPAIPWSHFVEGDSKIQKFQQAMAKKWDVDEKLFWKDGDEGTWDLEEGVPVWV